MAFHGIGTLIIIQLSNKWLFYSHCYFECEL